MRGASLAAVLIVAHSLGLSSQPLPWSAWLVPALIWHDVAVAAVFWVIDRATGRSRWMWVPYAVLVGWAALNVPVTRTLSSPLTVPMLRAAGGALGDSIAHYMTASNVVAMAIVLALGIVLPWSLRRMRLAAVRIVVSAIAGLAVLGPHAVSQVDTRGLHRNSVSAILATVLPRVAATSAAGDWYASPFEERLGADLTAWNGLARGRNVVFITLESTGARHLRLFGAQDDATPNLTALMAGGLRFERAYAVYPESIKGLFAAICAKEPVFDLPAERLAERSCRSLARDLRANGYRTGLFHSGRFAYLGMTEIVRALGFETAEDAGPIGGQLESSFGVDEPSAVKRMLAWIDAGGNRPFFLTYLPIAGHHPYAAFAPGPFEQPDERGSHRNAIFDGDRAIGTLIDGLAARSLLERTLFVIMGDHGEAFGEHPGNVGHSLFLYEENVHVPLALVAPGSAMTPGSVPRTASVIDVAPTVLDLLGISSRAEHAGRSLLGPRDRMALFFTDYSLGFAGLRDGCWKYILQIEAGRSQLFDLCVDPGEAADRSASEQARVSAYRTQVMGWLGSR